MIKEKELSNIKNIFDVYELPKKLEDFKSEDFKKLKSVIDQFEK